MQTTMKNIFVLICVFAIFAVVNGNEKPMRLKRTQICGVRKHWSGLIVNGQNFSRGSFPWIVALMYTRAQPPRYFCGGTLISKAYVVSAAHCIRQKESYTETLPGDVLALFGAHNLSNSFETGRYALPPKRIIKHEEWNPWTTEYDADVSLLEFERESIIFTTFVQPICLWDPDIEPNYASGSVTGWGRSEDRSKIHQAVPRLITVRIQSNDKCLPKHGKLAEISSERTFCAGLRNGSGVCHGDSGSGLFIEVNNVYHLAGIVSSSLTNLGNCDVSNNAVYTNVLKFRDWIDKTTDAASLSPTKAFKRVFCTFKLLNSRIMKKATNTCVLNQTIDNEDFVLGSPLSTTVEQFDIRNSRQVKFLPGRIGAKFPNLKEFRVVSCELSVLLDYYFTGMEHLKYLSLRYNRITTIESEAFKDLINLELLWLDYNMLETLDAKLFTTMVNLESLNLDNNNIEFLSPATFKTTGGKLERVNLQSNVCINGEYDSIIFGQLEADIRANCTR